MGDRYLRRHSGLIVVFGACDIPNDVARDYLGRDGRPVLCADLATAITRAQDFEAAARERLMKAERLM
jgi:hypothetical protein